MSYDLRSTTFRESILKIGEIRSLLPENTPVMALMATASRSVCSELGRIIGMKTPTMVILPPCKQNLRYTVSEYTNMDDQFTPMLQKLRSDRVNFPRTILYCQRMEDCVNLYI